MKILFADALPESYVDLLRRQGDECIVSPELDADDIPDVIKGVDVLADEGIRNGIKEFSNWPTIPQLYVKGEFIGGCDIIREMFQDGELHALMKDKGVLAA